MKVNADYIKTNNSTDNWATPKKLYDYFMNNGFIDLCPLNCTVNNLGKKVRKGTKIFMNPPFSQLDKWVDYAVDLYLSGCTVVVLMPSRTDTKYFCKLLSCTPTIYFFIGRLAFNDSKRKAPFPTLIVELNHLNLLPFWTYGDLDSYISRYNRYN